MKRKTLGKLFAVTAAGLISANAPIIAEAKEQQENKAIIAEHDDSKEEQEHAETDNSIAETLKNEETDTADYPAAEAETEKPATQKETDAPTDIPADFTEAGKMLDEAEKDAEKAQTELNNIQSEIIAIQTGIPEAQKKVEETDAIQKQAETEQAKAEEEKANADAAVSDTAQNLTDAQNAWNSTIDNAAEEADTLQQEKDLLLKEKMELQEAENTVEELETECADKKKEADNAAVEKSAAEASLQTKEELKAQADKAVSNAQTNLNQAQKDYELACEAEKSQNTGETPATGTQTGSSEENIDEIVNALKQAEQKIASGSLGFFQYLAETEDDAGAKAAVAILTSQNGTDINGLRPSYLWRADSWEQFYSYTHIGEENDATSLENMKRAIDFIEECNRLRVNDDNFRDCEPLTVNDAVMAIAQLNANWATYSNGSYHSHAAVFNTSENLAWYFLDRPGADNPFAGWYDLEKAIYDSKGSGVTGHYLNITNKELSVTGFGVNLSAGSGGDTRINCAQEFVKGSYYGGYGFGATYSAAEYKERFYKYYYSVLTELSNAQAAYNRVSGKPGVLVAEKKAALYQAQEKLESAKANADRAQALLNQAKEEMAAKEQKYNAAAKSLEESSQALQVAKTVLEQKTNAYQALKQEIEQKYADAADEMIAFVDAQAAYQKALLTQTKAADTLTKKQTAYKEAVAAHTKAIHEWNNLMYASISEKNQELKAAQERYAQAFERLAIAQAYYDRLNPNQGDISPIGPNGADNPNGTNQPNGTDSPSGIDNPNGTGRPGGTDNPNGTGRPNGTDSPSGTNQPNGLYRPNEAGNQTQTAQLDSASGGNGNFSIHTAFNHSSKVTFSKECPFASFVKISESILRESNSDDLTLDCSDTPWFSLNKKALSALKANPNRKLTIVFRYGGKKYTFTIPAGFDFDTLQDSNGWYGFMYLKMIFGGHEVE